MRSRGATLEPTARFPARRYKTAIAPQNPAKAKETALAGKQPRRPGSKVWRLMRNTDLAGSEKTRRVIHIFSESPLTCGFSAMGSR